MAAIGPEAGMPSHMQHLQTQTPSQTQAEAPALHTQPAAETLAPLGSPGPLSAPLPAAVSVAATVSTQEEPRMTTLAAVGTEAQMQMQMQMQLQLQTQTQPQLQPLPLPLPPPQVQMQSNAQPQMKPRVPATTAQSQSQPKPKRKNLSDQQRMAVVYFLLANSVGGKLKHGDMKAAATHFKVHRATIQRLWKLHLATRDKEGLPGNVASRIKSRSGRKPKFRDEELKARIAAVPAERRMTGRALSTALGVNNGVVVRLIRDGKLKRHPKKLHYVM